jgi:hypothetical protein
MKINAIKTKLTFQGLWGNTTNKAVKVRSDESLKIYSTEKIEYFPFSNESLEEANKVLKQNTSLDVYRDEKLAKEDCICEKYVKKDVCIKQYLLFSSKDWLDYLNKKISNGSYMHSLIENNLKKLHLEKYLRA